jgi:hypothetical protein
MAALAMDGTLINGPGSDRTVLHIRSSGADLGISVWAEGKCASTLDTVASHDTRPEEVMDLSTQLDTLQKHAADAKSAAQAASTETRDQLRHQIDRAQADLTTAAADAKKQAGQAEAAASSKWQQMKTDAASRMDDMKAKIDKRNDQIDASMAAHDAAWAEGEASDAIDYAVWTVDNARLAVLDAIDARSNADQLAKKSGA